MADDKNSFANRFKKGEGFKGTADGAGEGFKGTADGAGKGFAERFRPQKNPVSDDADDGATSGDESDDNAISKLLKDRKEKKPFSQKKGIKKSAQADDMSHAEKMKRRRSQNVFLVRGKDRGRAAWHYVLVDNQKREMFLAATKSGSLDVADYGEVLESGWGEDPPERVVKRIEEEFNL